jgi:vacuolar protein-sorting-associated protein 4
MPPPPPPHPSTNSGDNNSEPQKVPVDSADKKKDSEEDKFKAALESTIQTEKPNVHWEDVAGLEFAK